ncbi:hypothetical protein Taro_016690 [Colocasia esculenta]|uniref:Mitochondrial substrate carrier family protein n=1 Tax=Colocasia esculenta TaxID=4460 RepID=A0A843UKY7_COLES|nr:hypothetical protein [Colocasia esculenta]
MARGHHLVKNVRNSDVLWSGGRLPVRVRCYKPPRWQRDVTATAASAAPLSLCPAGSRGNPSLRPRGEGSAAAEEPVLCCCEPTGKKICVTVDVRIRGLEGVFLLPVAGVFLASVCWIFFLQCRSTQVDGWVVTPSVCILEFPCSKVRSVALWSEKYLNVVFSFIFYTDDRMAKKSPRNDRSSIKYRWIPLDLPCIDPGVTAPARGPQVGSCSQAKCDGKIASSSSNWTVTTPEFITAVGRLWKAVCQPVNVSQTKAGVESETFIQKEKGAGYSGSAGSEKTSICLHSDLLLSDPRLFSCFSPTAKSDFDHIKAIKRMILFDPYRAFLNSSFQGHTEVREFNKPVDSKMMTAAKNLGDPHQLVTKYEKIDGNPALKNRINLTDIDCELVAENCDLEKSMMETDVSATHSAKIHISFATNSDSSIGYSRETSCMESGANLVDNQVSSKGPPVAVTSVVEPSTISSCPNSSLRSDYNIECSPSIYCKKCPQSLDSCYMVLELDEDSIPEEENTDSDSKNFQNDPVVYRRYSPNVWLSVQNKIEDAFVKGKHAIAGGLAGIFVSLCLHPIDTVKTVIQADGLNQRPILHTVQSIISERGVLGLYRGIASNIASSAPISAIYTFTYESVKGALLPVLPKEYHSLAHCTAGGCASIATSFIFTPSERIKQQMQVHSYYQNSWNALIGVLEKGGLPSLYAGWSAVLCRNIPHSIIKFYTYERLKQLLQGSMEPDGCLNPLQTLLCGGLAGCTAALVTTPFDVVKTRLQAQVPGSLKKYDGVMHVLKEIAKYEGINGLYRGLTPRLFMYVSQGAIFFASYEFLKAAFSFQGSVTCARGIGKERYMEDD